MGKLLRLALSSSILIGCSKGTGIAGGNGAPTNVSSAMPGAGSTSSGTGMASTTAAWPSETDTEGEGWAWTSSTTSPGSPGGGNGCPSGTNGCPCDAGRCGLDSVCIDGTCVPKIDCDKDKHEPNDSEQGSTNLGNLNDDDSNGKTFKGTIGLGEVDWFHYHGEDNIFNLVNPERMISSTGGIRVCKFVHCVKGLGATDLRGCPGGQETTSPSGRPGCCSSSQHFGLDFKCVGTAADDATIYLSISEPSDQCVDYSISFHY